MAEVVTTVQAARVLRVTRRRVDALIASERLPARRVGRDWLIRVADLALVKDRRPGRPKKIPRVTKRVPKKLASPEEIDQGLFTVAEAAKLLHVARTTIYGLMERGQLQYVKIGKARRIPKAALRDFVSRNLKGAWKL